MAPTELSNDVLERFCAGRRVQDYHCCQGGASRILLAFYPFPQPLFTIVISFLPLLITNVLSWSGCASIRTTMRNLLLPTMGRFRFAPKRRVNRPTGDIELIPVGQSGGAEQANKKPSAPYTILFLFTDRSQAILLFVGVLFAILKGVAAPAAALATGKIFGFFSDYQKGSIKETELIHSASTWAIYIVIIGAVKLFLQGGFYTAWTIFGELQAKRAREKLFTTLLDQDVTYFDSLEEGSSALMIRLNAQIKDLQAATSIPLGSIPGILASAGFSLGLAIFYSWRLTLIILATLPVLVTFMAVTTVPIAKYNRLQSQRKADTVSAFTRIVASIVAIKCNNAESQEQSGCVRLMNQIAYWYYKTINIYAAQQGFVQFLSTCLFVQAFYYGSTLVLAGEKSPGDILTTFLSAISVYTALNQINSQMVLLELGRVAGGNMREIMTRYAADRSVPTAYMGNGNFPMQLYGSIKFNHVDFAYPSRPNVPVLKDFNMKIETGTLSFIVGRSGSGKSTLGQLLTRLYEPTGGGLTIQGISVTAFDKKDLRKYITLVEQQCILFNDTIRENIALSKQRGGVVTEEDITNAIEFAELRQTVLDMPEHDLTPVGRFGDAISGGQRQRVALARAYIRDAPILVLDESTSALDQINREIVMNSIREWRTGKDRTTIIITHDLELIRPDDYVFVMESGRLVNEGHKCDIEQLEDPTSPLPIMIRQVTPEDPFTTPFDAPHNPNCPLDVLSQELEIEHMARESRLRSDSLASLYDTKLVQSPSMQSYDSFTPLTGAFAMQNRFSITLDGLPWTRTPQMSPMKAEAPLLPISPSSSRPKLAPSNSRNLELVQTLTRSQSQPDDQKSIEPQVQHVQDRIRDARDRRRISIQLHSMSFKDPDESEEIDSAERLSYFAIIKTVWPMLTCKQRWLLILAITCCAVHAAASALTSFLAMKLIGTFSFNNGGKMQARDYSIGLIALATIDGLAQYTQQRAFEYVAQCWANFVRAKAIGKVLIQPKAFFDKPENNIVRLTETVDRYTDLSRNIIGRITPLYTMMALVLGVAISWSTITEWHISLVMLGFLPIILGLVTLFGAVSRKYEAKCNEAATKVMTVFVETFSCIRTVKLLTTEHHFLAKATQLSKDTFKIGVQRGFLTGILSGATEASQSFAQAAIFAYAARLVGAGESVANISLVMLMLIMTFSQVGIILGAIPQVSLAMDAASRVLKVSNLSENSHESAGSSVTHSVSSLEMRNVVFAYPSNPQHKVLRGVSLRIERGEYVAIVGRSGSGKSTIASLLLRLYGLPGDSAGEIFLSNRRIEQFDASSLRRRIALVQQSNPVIAGTLADNIAYGIEHPNTFHMTEAAEAAGLLAFISSLPDRYNTLIGEGGEELSGGQKQRLAIARALMRQPDILILDEATSALDADAAAWIKQTVKDLARRAQNGGRSVTVIAITHDRRMIEGTDRVIVVERGQVVEDGNYYTLMKARGPLKKLMDGASLT